MATEKSDNIKVAVRIRGLIPREIESKSVVSWAKDGENCIVRLNGNDKFCFDKVYGTDQKTHEIFQELINPIMEDVMAGINGTVFAYGQTSSGKTFTMLGGEGSQGIIHMCINSIFNRIENTPEREYLITTSYMEIYNENIVDLLGDRGKSLALGENLDGEVIVKELQEEAVKNVEDCFDKLRKGEKSRHYEQTNMNDRSSRSHVIFRVIIESQLRDKDGDKNASSFFVSQLNLIDLAGSEKAKQTGSTGQRLVEGSYINKSLLSISNVITQLSTNSSYISYRDSKLTRILQNSLGGNSKTAFICAVTPVAVEETLSTLRFAIKVKSVKNQPTINEKIPESAQLPRLVKEREKLLKELDELKKQLASERKHNETLNLDVKGKCDMIEELQKHITVSSQSRYSPKDALNGMKRRRETWCPGKQSKMPAFQPIIHEDFEDGSMESLEAMEGVQRSTRISCPTFEPTKVILPKNDFSLPHCTEVDEVVEKYEFDITMKDNQIRALVKKVKILEKQLAKKMIPSYDKYVLLEDLTKQIETFYAADEEMVNSMSSPIKNLKGEDKLLQTSFILVEKETDSSNDTGDQKEPTSQMLCEREVQVAECKDVVVQTSFINEDSNLFIARHGLKDTPVQTSPVIDDDSSHVVMKCPLELIDAPMQTSFQEDEFKCGFDKNHVFGNTQTSFVMDYETLKTCEHEDKDAQTSFLAIASEELQLNLDPVNNSGEIKQLEEKLGECVNKIGDYEVRLSDYKRKQCDYEEQLSITNKRRKGFEDEIESLREEVSRLSGEVQSRDLTIEQYKAEMKENELRFENISDLFANSKIDLDNLRSELQATTVQHQELKNKVASGSAIQEEQKILIENLRAQQADALKDGDALKNLLEVSGEEIKAIREEKILCESMVESLKRELEDLNKMYFEYVGNMEAEKLQLDKESKEELEVLKKKLLEEERKYQEEVELLTDGHRVELESQYRSLKQLETEKMNRELEALTNDYEDRLLQLSNEMKDLGKQHELELADLNDQVSRLQEDLNSERNAKSSADSSAEVYELERRLEEITKECEGKIRKLEEEQSNEIDELNRLHLEVIEEIKSEFSNSVGDEELQCVRQQLEDAKCKLEENIEKCAKLETELVRKVEELKDAVERIAGQEVVKEKLIKEHEDAILLLVKERDALQSTLECCKNDVDTLKQQHARKLESIDAEHKESMTKMIEEHSELMEGLEFSHAKEIEDIIQKDKEAHDHELNTLKATHMDELKHLERVHEEKLSLVKADNLLMMEQVKSEYMKRYEEVSNNERAGAQKEADKLLESYKEQIKQCNQKCSDIKDEFNIKIEEIKELKSELARYSDIKNEFNIKVEENEKLKSELERYSDIENEFDIKVEEIKHLKSELERYSDIENEFDIKVEEIKELKSELARYSDIKNEFNIKVEENEKLKSELERYSDIENEFDIKVEEIKHLKSELARYSDIKNEFDIKVEENEKLKSELERYSDIENKFDIKVEENERLKSELERYSDIKNEFDIKVEEIKNLKSELARYSDIKNEFDIKVEEIKNLKSELARCSDIKNEFDIKVQEINKLKSELDVMKSSATEEAKCLQEKHTEHIELMERLHGEKIKNLSSECEHLKLRIKELEDDCANRERTLEKQNEMRVESLKKELTEERNRLLMDQQNALEETRKSHIKELEEVKNERDSLGHLKCFMEKRFLQLLSTFQIDISLGLAGKMNPSKEEMLDNLLTSLSNFINSKAACIEQLSRDLSEAKNSLNADTGRLSQLTIEFSERERCLKEDLETTKSALKYQESETMRYKEARDALWKLKNSLQAKNRDWGIKYEGENMLRISEEKRAEECRVELAKMKEIMEADNVQKEITSLRNKLNKKELECAEAVKNIERLKEKVIKRDERHEDQKLEIVKLRGEVSSLKRKVNEVSSVASMPAVNVPPFSRPQEMKSEHSSTSDFLLATMSNEISTLREKKGDLEKKNHHLEEELIEGRIEIRKLKKLLKKNKENSENRDEGASDDTVALFAMNTANADKHF